MEYLSDAPEAVEASFDVTVIGQDTLTDIPTTWRYSAEDPVAVQVIFPSNEDEPPIKWVFARQLIEDGLTQPTGPMDVRFEPGKNSDAVLMQLSSPSGSVTLRVPKKDLMNFLESSYRLIPLQREAELTGNSLDQYLRHLL